MPYKDPAIKWCNIGLGMFGDSAALLARAHTYLLEL